MYLFILMLFSVTPYTAYSEITNHDSNPQLYSEFEKDLELYQEAMIVLDLKSEIIRLLNTKELWLLMSYSEYHLAEHIFNEIFKICERIRRVRTNSQDFDDLFFNKITDDLYNYKEYFKFYDIILVSMTQRIMYRKAKNSFELSGILKNPKLFWVSYNSLLEFLTKKGFNIYAMIEEAQYGNKTTPNH